MQESKDNSQNESKYLQVIYLIGELCSGNIINDNSVTKRQHNDLNRNFPKENLKVASKHTKGH